MYLSEYDWEEPQPVSEQLLHGVLGDINREPSIRKMVQPLEGQLGTFFKAVEALGRSRWN